jgi:hypothetical protein
VWAAWCFAVVGADGAGVVGAGWHQFSLWISCSSSSPTCVADLAE